MAAANVPLLVNYLAVARVDGGILASYARIDDPTELSSYASFLRKICDEADILARVKANAGNRFHKVIESDDKGGEPVHCHWLGEYASETSNEGPFMIYFAVVTDQFAAQAPHSASALLVQLKDNLVAKYADQFATATEGSLTKEAAKLMGAIAFTHGLSKIAQVDDALRKVKDQMQANIEVALGNVERLQQMEADAEALEEEARRWEFKTNEVKKVMCWKKWKTQLLLGAIVIIILIVIIAPIASSMSNSSSSSDNN